MPRQQNRYELIAEYVFDKYYLEGAEEVRFTAQDMIDAAEELGVRRPDNMADVGITSASATLCPLRSLPARPRASTGSFGNGQVVVHVCRCERFARDRPERASGHNESSRLDTRDHRQMRSRTSRRY